MIVVYSSRFEKMAFMPYPLSEGWKLRFKYLLNEIYENNLETMLQIRKVKRYDETVLSAAHTKEYIKKVKEASRNNEIKYLDYGDTISYKGVFDDALLVVSATLTATEKAKEGNIVFQPNGGYHHAKEDQASGFCIFNDIAIAAKSIQKQYRKIAIVDIDLHHGDDTQFILYKDPILKISMHAYGIFLGTSSVYEIGEGRGKGYNINIPLRRYSGDDAGIYAVDNVIIPALETYEPEFLIVQMGADGHKNDEMSALRFSYNFYVYFARKLRNIIETNTENKFVGLGGGGYNLISTVNSWLLMLSEISKEFTMDISLGESTKGYLEDVKKKVDKIKELVDWI